MKHSLRFVSLALVLVLLLAACQPVQAPAGDSGPQTYVLGVAQPFTGPLGSFGTDFGKAIELAVSEMNAELSAAGSNVQFQIASADTEGTPDGAAKAVQTVVQTSGAQVVVGPLTTSEILGAKQFLFDPVRCHGRGVQHHEGSVGAVRLLMDHARCEFLAGA